MEVNLLQMYIKELNKALREVPQSDTDDEFKKLIVMESRFARKLRSIAGGKKIYRDFISFILQEEENLIMARKFFREREGVFKDSVYPFIRKNQPSGLHGMRVNFLFCSFAMKNLQNTNQQLSDIFEQVKSYRETLVHKHLHHALNKAKTFNRAAGNFIDFDDLVQIANEALVNVVDKYVPDIDAPAFHTVAIGRITAHLIASSNQTLAVSLTPGAARRLYNVKRLLERVPDLSTKEISDLTGIIETEVVALMNVGASRSLDEGLSREDSPYSPPSITLKDFLPSQTNEYNDPYLHLEKKNLFFTAAKLFDSLGILEQKALRLKGVNFKDYAEELYDGENY